MGWFSKLIGAVSKEERAGIRLNTDQPYWEIEGPKTFGELLYAFDGWLPEGAIMYFEGGSPDKEINHFLAKQSIPEQAHVALGTIWPRPKVFHVPATAEVLNELARIMAHHAEPELAVHLHVYRGKEVLLEWYDAFSDPLLMSGIISEEQVKMFANKTKANFKKITK